MGLAMLVLRNEFDSRITQRIGFHLQEATAFLPLIIVLPRTIDPAKQSGADTGKFVLQVRPNNNKNSPGQPHCVKDTSFVLGVHPNTPHPKVFIMGPKCSSFLFCDSSFPTPSEQFHSRNVIRSKQLRKLLLYFLSVYIESALIYNKSLTYRTPHNN